MSMPLHTCILKFTIYRKREWQKSNPRCLCDATLQHNQIDYVGIGVWESKKIVLSVKNIAEVLCKPRSNQLIIYIVL